jgi:hypothetical protein
MKRWASLLLAFGLVFGPAAAPLAAPPRKVEIAYQVLMNGLPIGEITQRLEHDGRSYRLTENWKGKGAFAMRGDAARASRGTISADGLRPQHFEDKRTGRTTRQADFDPGAKTPTLQRQDQLSLFWTFAFAPPRGLVRVNVADGERLSEYDYQPAGKERVKTPAGEFDALKFVKKRDDPEDKITEVWLSVDRQIPVRILVVDKGGKRLDQVAAKITTQ